jgi:hypothetical protein
MKINKTMMALLLSGAVGSTTALAATPQPGIEHHGQQGQQPYGQRYEQSQHGQAQQQHHLGTQQVKIVEKDKLEKKLTANDLLGKEVYTSDNERIGKVENLHLQGGLFSQIEREFVRDQDDQEAQGWRDQVRERQDVSGIRSPDMRDAIGTYGQQQQVQVMAIIETENDKLLSVPVSQLRYNADEERFQISLTQSQFEQLQERSGESRDEG